MAFETVTVGTPWEDYMQHHNHELATLAARLTAAERSLRRQRLLGIAALFVASTVLLMGSGPTATPLTATELRLVDDAGRLRGLFSVTKQGLASLALLDENGKPRTTLTCAGDGTSTLAYLTDDGASRMLLAQGKAGDGSLVFTDENKQKRVMLTGVTPGLLMRDAEGQNRVVIGVSKNGGGTLAVTDQNGKKIR